MLLRQHLFAICLALLLMLPLSSVWAVDETLLTTGRIATADISAFPSDEQLRSALAQVLIKVSGQGNITDREAARFLLQDEGRFMQQFRFAPLSEPDSQGMTSELEVVFDGRSLVEEMRELGVPVVAGRPTVLLWLAQEQGGRRDFVDSSDDLILRLQQESRRRGLPLLLPMYDLADQQALPVDDLWGFFSAPLQQASVRYGADLVMAARTTGSGDAMQIQASIWALGAQQVLQASGDTQSAARQLIDQVADIALQSGVADQQLAPSQPLSPLPSAQRPQAVQPIQPTPSGSSMPSPSASEPFSATALEFTPPGILVTIYGLGGAGAYLEATNLLRNLSGVQSVMPATLMQDSAQVRLVYEGSSIELEQLLDHEPRLQRRSGGSSLEYVWN